MFTKKFWRMVSERAVKSGAQSVLLAIGASDALMFNMFDLDFQVMGGFALGGAFLSVLTSLISLPLGENDSPSAIA